MSLSTSASQSPLWLLRELDISRRQAAASLLADLPVADPAQYFLLFYMDRTGEKNGPPSQRELAQGLHLAPATITVSLNALERHGFIRRVPDAGDRRVKRVELTEAGHRQASEGLRRLEALKDTMFQGFAPEELKALSDFFLRMCRNLSSLLPDGKDAV